MTNLTVTEFSKIMDEAQVAGHREATAYFNENLKGQDNYPCGFARVVISKYNGKKIDGRTKIGAVLKAAKVKKDYNGTFYISNPAKMYVQNVDTLFEGAKAAAEVFNEHGFTAYAISNLD